MPRSRSSSVRKVFLSSTAKDLGPCRDAVFKAISGLDGYQCIRMEDFGARDREADPFCRSRVAECDIFVGLIGYLYGSAPPGSEVSFTQGEHEAAVEAGIPRLLFLASDSFLMTLREPDALWQRQQAFRERVKQERVVSFFEDPHSLVGQVVAALRNLELKRPSAARKTRTGISPRLNKGFDVFLSHNSKDKTAVREIAEALRARGLKVWLDEWELMPGRPWQEALEEIIETTRSSVVLVGKDGLGPWQDAEMRGCLSEFVDRKLPVIPVLLPGAPEVPRLPFFLKRFIWVDLRGGLTEEGIDRLEWGVTGKRPDRSRPH